MEEINIFLTDEQILKELGERVKTERIRQGMTQETLSAKSGVGKSTVERFEKGESLQLLNLIRILRTLNLLQNLQLLIPSGEPSPMEYLYNKSERQRKRYYTIREKTPKYSAEKNRTSATTGTRENSAVGGETASEGATTTEQAQGASSKTSGANPKFVWGEDK